MHLPSNFTSRTREAVESAARLFTLFEAQLPSGNASPGVVVNMLDDSLNLSPSHANNNIQGAQLNLVCSGHPMRSPRALMYSRVGVSNAQKVPDLSIHFLSQAAALFLAGSSNGK